jgi:hypothetical protein
MEAGTDCPKDEKESIKKKTETTEERSILIKFDLRKVQLKLNLKS